MKNPALLLAPAALALLLVAPPAAAETKKLALDGARAEVYKHASGDDLYAYVFEPPGHQPATDRRPAIVFFFGGGWVGGTPAQFEQHARYLAHRGLVAICADYRVKSRQQATPDQCVADGKSAIRWVRAHAARLGIDPDRVAAGGGSAGGHVAAAAGLCDGLDDPADPQPALSSKPNALVLFNPVYDNGPDGWGHAAARPWFPRISPAHNITPDDPPAIVFLGTRDDLIPVATAEKFKTAMIAAGLTSELHLYPDQPHGFFNESKGGPDIFADTLRKMDAFLTRLGYLTGSPDEAAIRAQSRGKTDAPAKAAGKQP